MRAWLERFTGTAMAALAAIAVLLLAVGGAVAAVLYATLHNNDLNFGGSVTVVSPTK